MSKFRNPNQISIKLPIKIPKLQLDATVQQTPKHSRTGSTFTELKSGRSNRSRFSSNSKLTSSSLFKVFKKGNSTYVQGAQEQRNLQIQLLTQMALNLAKEEKYLLARASDHFKVYEENGNKILSQLFIA